MKETWLTPFTRALEYFKEINTLVYLSARGIKQVSNLLPLAKAHNKASKAMGEKSGFNLNQTKALTDMAQKEVERDFPILHAHALVAIWSCMDNLTDEVLAFFIRNDPQIKGKEEVRKVRISVADFEVLDEEERAMLLAQEVKSGMNWSLKRGVSRFNSIFNFIGAQVEVDDKTRKSIFALGSLRNCIVHKGGRIDRKLLSDCPWIKAKAGDELRVSHSEYASFVKATDKYLGKVLETVLEIQMGKKSGNK